MVTVNHPFLFLFLSIPIYPVQWADPLLPNAIPPHASLYLSLWIGWGSFESIPFEGIGLADLLGQSRYWRIWGRGCRGVWPSMKEIYLELSDRNPSIE